MVELLAEVRFPRRFAKSGADPVNSPGGIAQGEEIGDPMPGGVVWGDRTEGNMAKSGAGVANEFERAMHLLWTATEELRQGFAETRLRGNPADGEKSVVDGSAAKRFIEDGDGGGGTAQGEGKQVLGAWREVGGTDPRRRVDAFERVGSCLKTGRGGRSGIVVWFELTISAQPFHRGFLATMVSTLPA